MEDVVEAAYDTGEQTYVASSLELLELAKWCFGPGYVPNFSDSSSILATNPRFTRLFGLCLRLSGKGGRF
jgi:hypothetical protein